MELGPVVPILALLTGFLDLVVGQERCRYIDEFDRIDFTSCPETCCVGRQFKQDACCRFGEENKALFFTASAIPIVLIFTCLVLVVTYICCRTVRANRRLRSMQARRSTRNGGDPFSTLSSSEINVICPPPYEGIDAPPLYSQEDNPIFPGTDNLTPPKYQEIGTVIDSEPPPEYTENP